MKTERKAPGNIDEYISNFPPETRTILRKLRLTIRTAAPAAEEVISYQMPAFKLKGNLVYFAAFKNHVGFFPTSTGVEKFKKELTTFETSRGTIRFPLDKPIPFGLISRIVKFRVKENLKRAGS